MKQIYTTNETICNYIKKLYKVNLHLRSKRIESLSKIKVTK